MYNIKFYRFFIYVKNNKTTLIIKNMEYILTVTINRIQIRINTMFFKFPFIIHK